jgi:hypothetical protein
MKKIFVIPLFILVFSFSVFSQEAKLFDKFSISSNCEYIKAILNVFANELKKQPNAKGYIVYYGGRYYPILKSNKKLKNSLPRANEAKSRTKQYESYLLIPEGLPSARFELIDGGFREEYEVELWIIPNGAKLPEPKPTVKASEIKIRKGKISNKELSALVYCGN